TQHTDDLHFQVVDSHAAAYNCGICAEASAPEGIADEDAPNLIYSLIGSRGEEPAESWADTQERKEIVRNACGRQMFHFGAVVQVCVDNADRGEVFEQPASRP